MFSDNKKDRQNLELVSSQNIISKGTKIVGDLISEGDLRIDGTIEGNLKTPGKIVVGKTGVVKGTLDGTDAHFEGKFSGKLNLTGTLTLRSSAHIEGEVTLGKLEVEPGATFNVTCAMQGAIKESRSKNEQKGGAKKGEEQIA
ncbi:polymer-forming cytoskeletal protein [Xanthomarina sp. F1114]|uniref:bactofilin family protein n=1 Tax=Xanthomarina sp. F1114 TaxID=2996019 RepID=UPI00225E29D3|nr:polymer-forming cytoskeletal protein [Xanthomarina sp. F1114]MCX7548812.1 polymer-forming cytoskeletal protein [Xanthomarina sp. F1114]